MTAKLFNIPNVEIPLPLVIIIVIFIGAIIGAINGFFVTVVGLNSIITTLGTLAIFRGLCYVYGLEPLTISNQTFTYIGRGYILKNIPLSFFYMTVIFIIGYLALRFTVFGRKVYLVGANLESAILSGIQFKKIQFTTFIISGATAAISGILLTSQLNYAQGEFGLGYEFKILTICVLGGISLMGGRGTLVGVIVATFILGSIASGLALIGMPLNWREAIHGGILIMAILIDSFRLRRRELLRE
jgi:ribose transport system permease protein